MALIEFKKYRDLIDLLFYKNYYWTYKNPAKNITLDYFIGKDKTTYTIKFEVQTRSLRITKPAIKKIIKQIRKENQENETS